MKLETPLIGLLIASLIFSGLFGVFVLDLGDEYNADINMTVFETQNNGATLQESFEKINETKAQMDELNADFQDEEVTDSGSLFGFLKLTWTIGKQTLGSTNLLKELFMSFAQILGVPPMFVKVGISILIISLIIGVVMILAGRTY